jgi:hypothetical protein
MIDEGAWRNCNGIASTDVAYFALVKRKYH